MSYCRFSSDNWRSHIYCYASVGDFFAIHVAANKVVGDIPEEPPWSLASDNPEKFLQQHNAVMEFLQTAERAPIGLPHDGETFEEPDAASAAERLIELKRIGYNVPQYAIDALLEEVEEERNESRENNANVETR